MEIKCKVSFSLPSELMEAFEVREDTPIHAYVKGDRIVVVIAECYHDEDFDDNEDFTEDDLYDEDDFDCDEDECEYCEYYCQHCGKCVLN